MPGEGSLAAAVRGAGPASLRGRNGLAAILLWGSRQRECSLSDAAAGPRERGKGRARACGNVGGARAGECRLEDPLADGQAAMAHEGGIGRVGLSRTERKVRGLDMTFALNFLLTRTRGTPGPAAPRALQTLSDFTLLF